ncbi:hypothetical protein VAWG002_28220 [Aeromonas veronii]|nr:hypothetical protein VAWG002_28220 [Aeromonas veronii]
MNAEQLRTGLQALLDKLEAIDLSPEDRDCLTRGIQQMMPVTAAG